jgi:homoserine kinase type II
MAVYTDVDDDALEAFLARYDVGEALSLKGIAEGVENSNYLVQTDRGASYILTLYEKRVKREDLPFFLGLMEHLAAAGIPCPTPIRARDGAMIQELCGRPAAMIAFLQGLSTRRVMPEHCRAVGDALARLHQAGAAFALMRPNALSVAGWRTLADAIGPRADEVRPGLHALIAQSLADIAAHWPADLPRGVIHADLFPDNVLFLPDHRLSGMIDFYFACNDFYAYDLAICLNAWCFEKDLSFNATKAKLLVGAYAKVRPLAPREMTLLPLLARGSALRFLLTRLYDWLNQPPGALVRPHDPLEYEAKLRFHARIRSAAAYGL